MKKNKLIEEFEQSIKEAAIDGEIFKNANVYAGEKKLTCN
jgi:hypothetical protein